MRALLLDASTASDTRTRAAADALERVLRAREIDVERVTLREITVRSCTGCFGCWVAQPGRCVIADDARFIAERAIASDVFAVVSPVVYGSYGSLAKRVLDRMIGLVLPHFTMIDGQVHHQPRYKRYPIALGLGTLECADAEQEALFARLVERNATNLHNPAYAAAVATGDADPASAAERLMEAAGIGMGVPA